MSKPVVTDFLGNTAPLKAAVAEASAALASYDAQVKRGTASADRLAAANDRWAKGLVLGAKVGAVGVAGIATALGGAALAAVGFDAAMRNVNSIAGLNQKGFKALEQQLLRLAPAIGSTPTDLAKGLYDIVSTGFKASDAIKVLAVSAKAGKAGLTDTATATDAITSALKAYGLGAGQAKHVSDLLFETVDVGKLNFQQLAGSIGTVLPVASTLGVPLKQLGAAIATITLNGTDANTATTQLRAIFTAFEKPTKDLTATFKAQGYESATLALRHLGLKGALDVLQKQVGSGHNNWVDFFKDVRALNGAQGLEGTANAVKLYSTSTKAMDDAVKGAGATQKAFLEQSKSTQVQFDKLKASVDVAAITIGSALLPELNKGIQALSAWLTQAQKSGELQHFAQTISTDVKATVKWLESLGPAAEKGIHVVALTFAAAIPYAQGVLHIVQAIEPELQAVAHAAVGVTSALGPGVILGGAAAYLTLNRAVLTTQAGVGKFASIMKAGAQATALAGGGAVSASGRIDAVGKAAITAESNAKIFARGIAASFGPQLLVVGAAGIIGSILLIESNLKSLDQSAREAADAFVALENARLGKQGAALDVKVAQRDLVKAKSSAGSAAVQVASTRTDLAATQGHPGAVADPAALDRYNAALGHQRDVIDSIGQAQQRVAVDQANLAKSAGDVSAANDKLAGKFKTVVDAALLAGSKTQEFGKAGGKTTFAPLSQQLDTLASKFQKNVAAADGSTAADRRKAAAVSDLVKQMTRLPNEHEIKIITHDIASGNIAKIRADLIALGLLKPTPKVDADTTPATQKIATFKQVLAGLAGNPFTVKINEAPGRTGHFTADGKWVYAAATGMAILGRYDGVDDTHVMVGSGEAILNEKQIGMVDSGRYSVMGALAATGAPTIGGAGGYATGGKKALFGHEGPDLYQAAYAHNRPFALPPIDRGSGPYQTPLSDANEAKFRAWVKREQIWFNPNAAITDYDMRGYWLSVGGPKTGGPIHAQGVHFTDRFKTPYDTTFSRESMYATSNNPFRWKGDDLIDARTGQLIFGPPMSGHSGGGKPPKRPKLPQFAAFPQDVYDQRASNAHTKLTNDRGNLKTMRDHRRAAQKAINEASAKLANAKTPKERAAAQAALLAAQKHNQPIVNSLLPREPTLAETIATDTSAYQEANRIAKAADAFAARIKADQDAVSQATSEMQLASDNWGRAKTPADQRKYLQQYNAAAARRSKGNQTLELLMKQVQAVVKDPNSQYFRDNAAAITAAQIDDLAATDPTQVPGYISPDDSPVFLTPEQQYQLDRALQTDANGNPIDPGTAKYLLGLELGNAQAQEAAAAGSGNFTLASQIVSSEESIKSQIAGLSQGASGPDADTAAQLAQSQAQVVALTRASGYQSAFDAVRGGSSDLAAQGGFGAMVFLGDTRSLQAGASFFTKGVSQQPAISQNSGSLNV